jgi:phosphatidate cytidylyltransferase
VDNTVTVAPNAVPGAAVTGSQGGTLDTQRRGSSVAIRFVSGVFAVPFLLGVAYVGFPAYGAFISIACAYAAWEIRGMLRTGGFEPQDLTLFGVAVLLPLDAWLRPDAFWLGSDAALLLTVVVLASLILLLFRPTADRALIGWGLSLGLALYIGGLMQFYMPLRTLPTTFPGFWVMALLALSWVCDSSAFFIGRAFGRTKLAPHISPKKSVEGAVAGLIAPALVGPLLGMTQGLPPLLMAGYGLAIAVATIVGDLVESLIKRQTGVKDSGVLIPGHGGLLDRMDSLLFCAPVAVLYLHAFLTS